MKQSVRLVGRCSSRWLPRLILAAIALPALASLAQPEQITSNLRALHALNRLTYGPRPGDIDRVNSIGVDAWIDQQLHPGSVPIPAALTEKTNALQTLRMNSIVLARTYGKTFLAGAKKQDPEVVKRGFMEARVIMVQAVQNRFDRAINSPRQLQEVMVDFWFNHFNVFAGKGLDRLWTGAYEQEAIRPYALGNFRDLLGATARHPAMLFYLDNWQNTAPGSPGSKGKFEGLNENYAREVMELHTLGVDGGYTQHDVTELARIFTGWGLIAGCGAGGGREGRRVMQQISSGGGTGFYFDPRRHDFGDKVFLGQTINGSGIAEGEQALDILARSPATAHHISYRLAQYFVADKPPNSLVRKMADRFIQTDGNITAVLETLFRSPEFWDQKYYANKYKTPYQYVISAVRAAGDDPINIRPLYGVSAQQGMPLYGCVTPDGFKNTQDAWLNPDSMMRRLSFATAFANGRLKLNSVADESPQTAAETDAPKPAAATMGQVENIDFEPARLLDPDALALAIGNRFSHQTVTAYKQAPVQLRAAMIVGSPEFMMR
jgi:uncharacterized protein (DUF1800 family)